MSTVDGAKGVPAPVAQIEHIHERGVASHYPRRGVTAHGRISTTFGYSQDLRTGRVSHPHFPDAKVYCLCTTGSQPGGSRTHISLTAKCPVFVRPVRTGRVSHPHFPDAKVYCLYTTGSKPGGSRTHISLTPRCPVFVRPSDLLLVQSKPPDHTGLTEHVATFLRSRPRVPCRSPISGY